MSSPSEPRAERDPSSRDGFALRAILFGLVGTLALTGPALLGLDYAPWRGLDGALALLLVVGVSCFGWPPVERRGAARGLLDLSVATGSLITFGLLGATVADGVSGAAGPALLAGALAMALVWTGRLGGWPGAAAVLALAALLGWGGEEERSAPAPGPAVEMLPVDLSLRGPLVAALLRVGDAPPLEIRAELGAGASRQLRAWIPVPAQRPPGPVSPRVEALSPRCLVGDGGPGSSAPDGRVVAAMGTVWSPAPGLAARQRPPLPTLFRRAPAPAGLLGAWAVLLLLLAVRRSFQRRRPWLGAALGAAVGAGAALGLSWLPDQSSRRATPYPAVRALEGVAGAQPWLQVDRRRGVLRLDGLGPGPAAIELHGRPPRRCLLDLTGPEGRLELALGAGAIADLLRPLDPGLRPLQPEINGWGDLDPAWLREVPGGWRDASPWGLGEGHAAAGAEGPPLPLTPPPAWALGGVDGAGWVVLGGLSGEGFRGLRGPEGASGGEGPAEVDRGEVWIRVTEAPSRAGR